jgi:hypothetical protein
MQLWCALVFLLLGAVASDREYFFDTNFQRHPRAKFRGKIEIKLKHYQGH